MAAKMWFARDPLEPKVYLENANPFFVRGSCMATAVPPLAGHTSVRNVTSVGTQGSSP